MRKLFILMFCLLCSRLLVLALPLPLFSRIAEQYDGSSTFLIGLAMSSYALMQALFQFALGVASDKYGRKPVLLFGLSLFLLGCVFGALAEDIYMLTLARTLQGMGAITSVVLATLGDNISKDKIHTTFMLVGITIGLCFYISISFGALLFSLFNLNQFFMIAACMIAIFIVMIIASPQFQTPIQSTNHSLSSFKQLLRDHVVLSFLGIAFINHLLLCTVLYAVPILFSGDITFHYLVTLSIVLPLSMPLIRLADKKSQRWRTQLLIASAATLIIGLYLLLAQVFVYFALILFFWGFSIFEASVPAQISKRLSQHNRGIGMGLYAAVQYLGIFFGGILVGLHDITVSTQFNWLLYLLIPATLFIGCMQAIRKEKV